MAVGAPRRRDPDPGPRDRAQARRTLQRFDAYLDVLERSHLAGATRVGGQLAARLAQGLPGIRAGMLITDAIEMVLAAQEEHLVRLPCDDVGASRHDPTIGGAERMRVLGGGLAHDEPAARELTECIRRDPAGMCLLLAQAHAGRAWSALGYQTWEQYVRTELGISRSRSYEFLDQATVVRAIAAAAGCEDVPHLSTHAACQLKPQLDAVCEAIREEVAGRPTAQAGAAVEAVIGRLRAGRAEGRRSRRARPAAAEPGVLRLYPAEQRSARPAAAATGTRELRAAIAVLARQPRPDRVVAGLSLLDTSELVRDARRAADWLSALSAACGPGGRRQAT